MTAVVSATGSLNASNARLKRRLRAVIELHFDPELGSAYWLDRAGKLDFDPRETIRTVDDLHLLGTTSPEELSTRPLLDYIPRRMHDQMDQLIVGQTGGTTGGGTWTAYRIDEFEEAFVLPFLDAATAVNFPRGEAWLFVGPSGPHIIGKAAPRLARMMESADPFSVDFDPRWAKRLPDGSVAQSRYTQHVVEQAIAVIASQAIGVLFTTPAVLRPLAEQMTAEQRRRIRAVHYGGMALSAADLMHFQEVMFPQAVHLSGYGNTLLGCCLELNVQPARTLRYYPHGSRLHFEVLMPDGSRAPAGVRGRVCASRLDATMLIVRMVERDEASLIAPPADAPELFQLPGVEDPRPFAHEAPKLKVGLY